MSLYDGLLYGVEIMHEIEIAQDVLDIVRENQNKA